MYCIKDPRTATPPPPSLSYIHTPNSSYIQISRFVEDTHFITAKHTYLNMPSRATGAEMHFSSSFKTNSQPLIFLIEFIHTRLAATFGIEAARMKVLMTDHRCSGRLWWPLLANSVGGS